MEYQNFRGSKFKPLHGKTSLGCKSRARFFYCDLIYNIIIFQENELFTMVMTLIGERGEGMKVIRLVKKAKRGNKEALLQLIMTEKDVYYRLAFT